MVDVKEIKSIEPVPFTVMTASISAIIGLIYAIILLIAFGTLAAFLPGAALIFASLGISMIILYPIGAFLVYTTLSFITTLIYNMLVPRLGGVKLGLEGDQVTIITRHTLCTYIICFSSNMGVNNGTTINRSDFTIDNNCKYNYSPCNATRCSSSKQRNSFFKYEQRYKLVSQCN